MNLCSSYYFTSNLTEIVDILYLNANRMLNETRAIQFSDVENIYLFEAMVIFHPMNNHLRNGAGSVELVKRLFQNYLSG